MERSQIRSRTLQPTSQKSAPEVAWASSADKVEGNPRHQILFDSVEVVAQEKREAPKQESFAELLERLSQVHHGELSEAVERLESEKAELERQMFQLRRELVEQRERQGPCDDDQQPSPGGRSKERKRTRKATFAIASEVKMDEADVPSPAPKLLNVPGSPTPSSHGDTDKNESRNGSKGSRDEEADLEHQGEESFPPRSEYMEHMDDMMVVMEKSHQLSTNELGDQPPANKKGFFRGQSNVEIPRSVTTSARFTQNKYNSFMESFIASPRSKTRTVWEIVGCVLIGWDLFIVPLAVFCFPVNFLTNAMDMITLVYWTLNVPQTITVGYEAGLKTVMEPSSILSKYIKSWFLVDMVVLLPDWVILGLSFGVTKERLTSCDTAVEGAGTVKLLRNLRIMRLLRLTRIARLQKLWQVVKELIYSQTVSIAANILTMLLLLLVLSHFISCLWYAISDTMEGDDRWIKKYHMEESQWNYLYATCLHWSLTQFTPAPMNIQPQNFVERVFTISVVVCALVGFSYVVGSITGSLAQLRSLKEEESKLFWDLRVYLKRNAVDQFLSVRIQRYLQHAWRYQAQNKAYQQIKILTMLSEQLQNELLFQLHSQHLTVYPLIEKLEEISKVTAYRLARTAISTKQLALHDPLFILGEKPSHMYIVMQGKFQYKRMTSDGNPVVEQVDKGEDWIAEPVLWSTEWYHLGDCTAIETSSLTLVNPQHFCQEARRNPSAWALVTTYCMRFLKWLNATNFDELSDITQGDHKDKIAQLKDFMDIDPYQIRSRTKAVGSRSPPRNRESAPRAQGTGAPMLNTPSFGT